MKPTASPTIDETGLSWWLLALSLYLIAACPFGEYWYLPYHVCYSIAFLLLAWSLALNPVRFFVNPLTCYIGKISFSCYLLHDLALRFTLPYWQRVSPENQSGGSLILLVGGLLTALALTILFASATYYAIELPGINLGKKLIRLNA